MPVTLITTVGAANANSYSDVAFATNYFDGTIRRAQWNELPSVREDGGTILLFEAMTFIERLAYLGLRAEEDQALEFPRYGGAVFGFHQSSTGDHLRDLRSRLWPADEIPKPVKEAQCEQALAVGQNHRWLESSKYKAEKIVSGGTELTIATPLELGALSRAAMFKLQPFLLRGGQGATVR